MIKKKYIVRIEIYASLEKVMAFQEKRECGLVELELADLDNNPETKMILKEFCSYVTKDEAYEVIRNAEVICK